MGRPVGIRVSTGFLVCIPLEIMPGSFTIKKTSPKYRYTDKILQNTGIWGKNLNTVCTGFNYFNTVGNPSRNRPKNRHFLSKIGSKSVYQSIKLKLTGQFLMLNLDVMSKIRRFGSKPVCFILILFMGMMWGTFWCQYAPWKSVLGRVKEEGE